MNPKNGNREAFVVRTGENSFRINFYFNVIESEDLNLDYLVAFCSELLQEIKSKKRDISELRFESEQVENSSIFLRTWIYITLLGLPPFKDVNVPVRQIFLELDGFLEKITSQTCQRSSRKREKKEYSKKEPLYDFPKIKEGGRNYEMR